MKIIKVVVDEMPCDCYYCDRYDNDFEICSLTGREDVNDFARPSWCPLMSLEDYQKELDAGLDVYLGLDELIESEEE